MSDTHDDPPEEHITDPLYGDEDEPLPEDADHV